MAIDWEKTGFGAHAIKMRSEDGLSSNKIAARLQAMPGGHTITRSAVIGYLSRKGVKSVAEAPRSRTYPKTRRAAQTARPAPAKNGNPIVRALFKAEPGVATDNNAAADLANPSPDRQTILVRDQSGALHANEKLKSSSCRWPVGDPLGSDFHFCGREHVKGLSYCENHARRAYAPVARQRGQAPANTNTTHKLEAV